MRCGYCILHGEEGSVLDMADAYRGGDDGSVYVCVGGDRVFV